jgi:uncharacterized protein DUF4129
MFRHEVTSEPASRGTPSAGRPAAARIPLTILLLAVILVGLRGRLTAPHWDGPWHTDGTAVGLGFAVVLAALLTATLIRGQRAARRPEPEPAAVARLRRWLRAALTAGLVAVVILTVASTHFHLFGQRPRPKSPLTGGQPVIRPTGAGRPAPVTPPGSITPVLYGLLIALAVAAVVLGLVVALRHRRPAPVLPPGEAVFDPAGLREAVTSGRAALGELDDARAAIIACYVGMERSLARKGAARAAADTPDELLARATAGGIVHGAAAGRLTRLFYEARFSRHRLTGADRDQAARALDELASELRAPGPAGTESPSGTGTPAP